MFSYDQEVPSEDSFEGLTSGDENDEETFRYVNDDEYQDIRFDPKIPVSDHESDDEPSTRGCNDQYDTDDENISAAAEQNDCVPRTELEEAYWCKCSNCVTMESEIECYCCQESSLIFESVLKETNKCVTELNVFRKMIEETEVLEVQSFGQKGVCRDMEGKIKPESLRHIAYGTFLQICSLRFIGKGRRYVLPSCVVKRIRELYPSPDGHYVDFKEGAINSRV